MYTIGNLITDVLPRVAQVRKEGPPTGINIYGAANSILSLITKNLIKRHSDLLATGDLALVIPARAHKRSLPDDFISLAEKPYVEDLYPYWMMGMVTSYNNTTGALVINATVKSGEVAWADWQIAIAGIPGTPPTIVGTSVTTITPALGALTFITQTGLSALIVAGQFVLIFTTTAPSDALLEYDENLDLTPSPGIGNITLDISVSSFFNPTKRRLEPRYLSEDHDDNNNEWYVGGGMSYGTGVYLPSTWALCPGKYKIIGSILYVQPRPIISIIVKGRYFQRPAKFTAPTDVIPWGGMFDEIFTEGTVVILSSGIAIPETNPAFVAMFQREFDSVIDDRIKILPQTRTRLSNFM